MKRPVRLCNTFMLKTYTVPDAREFYTAERDAFMTLRLGGMPSPFLIGYYGSFVDKYSYNIILEYADRGSLETFMRETDAPSTARDMVMFWDRLCNIMHGLAHIHDVPSDIDSRPPVMIGYVTHFWLQCPTYHSRMILVGTRISDPVTYMSSVVQSNQCMMSSSSLLI